MIAEIPLMLKEISLALLIGLVGWTYMALIPPAPKICGTPGGPPVTAARIKLRDGRHLAYKEFGVSKETARYKIIFIHGFTSTRHHTLIVTSLSQEVVEKLGVCIVSLDKPGYGESDPDPKRSPKSLALDVEELADKLGFGSRFYVIGLSMGGQAVWGCLKYIPHRLAGAALVAPVINYWWSGFPANLCREAYYKQLPQDQWALRVTHYTPWLTYWWNTQKWFPASGVAARRPEVFSPSDLKIMPKEAEKMQEHQMLATQQGVAESLHRELRVGFGRWEFDPMDLENPFPNNEGSLHLWQGDDDRMGSVSLQRFIVKKLPWIRYHELPGNGHMFPSTPEMSEAIVKQLLLGKN